jgi:hypothetical protein
MRSHAAAARPRRRGLALVLVVVHSVLILSAWGMANRQSVSLIRLKGWLESREDSKADVRHRRLALGYALALLETGVPASSPYTCGAVVTLPGGGLRSYQLTYARDTETETRWSVAVAEGSIDGLDRPIRFGPPADPPGGG